MSITYLPRRSVDSTEAQNTFGKIAHSTAEGPIEITKHGRVEYVLINAKAYRELVSRAFPETHLSDVGEGDFQRLLAAQGAAVIAGADPMAGVSDGELRAALKRSLEAGGQGR